VAPESDDILASDSMAFLFSGPFFFLHAGYLGWLFLLSTQPKAFSFFSGLSNGTRSFPAITIFFSPAPFVWCWWPFLFGCSPFLRDPVVYLPRHY